MPRTASSPTDARTSLPKQARYIRDTITEMIVDGMHSEEVLAARPTAEYDAQWGQVGTWNAKDIVPIIYNELGGGPTLP